ncbi:MAG: hypothetical protein WC761_00540 [Candidatus Paceibacterota bacterium]|jgi:hypothetical protein
MTSTKQSKRKIGQIVWTWPHDYSKPVKGLIVAEVDVDRFKVLIEEKTRDVHKDNLHSRKKDCDGRGFKGIAFPNVRRVFSNLLVNDIVSVQPMSLPTGLTFFLDYAYSGSARLSGSK